MRLQRWGSVALATGLLVVAAATPIAWAETGGSKPCYRCGLPTARGGDSTITTEAGRQQHGTSDLVPGRGDPTQGRGTGRHDYFYINEQVAATCMGNGLLSGWDRLCGAAVLTCPVREEFRFWIWHQRVDVKVGNPDVVTFGPWKQEQGTFCLGPDDPGVPNVVTTLVKAYAEFEQKVRLLTPPEVKTTPGPRTLVNYETTFRASNATPFAFDVTVTGLTVHLLVHPTSFRWSFGDGTVTETTDPTAMHIYHGKGARRLRVDITWGGTFTVGNAAEVYAIDPPATVTGASSILTVVEARAENVA